MGETDANIVNPTSSRGGGQSSEPIKITNVQQFKKYRSYAPAEDLKRIAKARKMLQYNQAKKAVEEVSKLVDLPVIIQNEELEINSERNRTSQRSELKIQSTNSPLVSPLQSLENQDGARL